MPDYLRASVRMTNLKSKMKNPTSIAQSSHAPRPTSHAQEPRRSFTLFETVVLFLSLAVVSLMGGAAHRWMWEQAQLWSYRCTVQEIATTMRQMRFRAVHAKRAFSMRIDAAAKRLQLIALETNPVVQESLERTIWLPDGLEITQAPGRLFVSPTGELPTASILLEAPAFQRLFRVTTTPTGVIQLDEEPST